tara:strand:+ start:731 stop:934 length:204 start_codon:yes stop_codon:yes gene_type:complete
LGLIIIGPKRLPEVIKTFLKLYKRIENKFVNFKKDIEEDIGSNELRQDVFNELRLEELENSKEKDNE